MPPNTVSVCRPGKWGNPFKVEVSGGMWIVNKYKFFRMAAAVQSSIECYRQFLTPEMIAAARAELRGKDLACWCKEGDPCHADVLLEVAND